VADEVRLHFPNEVLGTAVPRSVRISEAPSYSQTVMTYDPASTGALAYREAAREIVERYAQVPGQRTTTAERGPHQSNPLHSSAEPDGGTFREVAR
jgi:chromosome partitioning protein